MSGGRVRSPLQWAEIIAVGSELLVPPRLDTNSLFITERLGQYGIEVRAKAVVGDRSGDLEAVLRAALARTELVVLCGGRARREALTARLDALRYQKPLDEVWAEARRMLAEKGYPLTGADAEAVGQKSLFLGGLFSPAKETRPDPAATQFLETAFGPGAVRYRMQGWANGSTSRIAFWAFNEDPTEHRRDAPGRTRDVDMELVLAWRIDPDAAAAIEAAVPPAPGG